MIQFLAFVLLLLLNVLALLCSQEEEECGLQENLEKCLGKKTPALILVPVVDLPGKEVIHTTCWLS